MTWQLVTVLVNGSPVEVPDKITGDVVARLVLGAPEGAVIAREAEPDRPLSFEEGHEFHEGERYVWTGLEPEDPTPVDGWALDPDRWKE